MPIDCHVLPSWARLLLLMRYILVAIEVIVIRIVVTVARGLHVTTFLQ